MILFLKAKKANIGEVRHRRNGPHMKKGPNKWVRVKKVGDKWVDADKRGGKKTKGLSDKPEKKSLKSKYYYQVPVRQDGKTLWKKYTNAKAYKEDYPNGPERGHILVNQNHPAHLRVDGKMERGKIVPIAKIWYAKIGDKTYANRAEFVKDIETPKKKVTGSTLAEKKGVDFTVVPNFRHPDWHPSMKEKLNFNQRAYLGVEEAYQTDRLLVRGQHDREAHMRAGKVWSKEEFLRRVKTGAERNLSAAPSLDVAPSSVSKEKRPSKAQYLRKGLRVFFTYRGKQKEGKIVDSKSMGKKGKAIKKAKTHYQIEWNTGKQSPTSLKGGKGKIQRTWVKKESITRKEEARKQISQLEQDEEAQKRAEKQIVKKIDKVFERMNIRDDAEFKTKVLDHMGNLNDPNNPVLKVVAFRARQVVASMQSRGMNPFTDLTMANIQEAGLVGVFDAILDWNPAKSKLTTFLQSDNAKSYIKNAINDALAVERNQFHKMSPEGKLAIFKVKGIIENMEANSDKKPSKEAIKKEFSAVYGHSKYDIAKLIDMSRNKRVKNIIENTDEQGELDLIENLHGHLKTPEEAYLEKEKMETFHGAMTKLMPEAKERQAVFLRFRLDESTTGKGVLGQESPYHKKKGTEDVSRHEGKTYTSKTPELRNYDEIAKMLGLKDKVAAQKIIEDALNKVRKKVESGHASAQELQEAMGLNKSYEEKRDFIRLYLFKSQFPEKRDRWLESQLTKARVLTLAILKAS